jgi:hypothetical protein
MADREIIEEELRKVFCAEPGEYVVRTCREVSGIFPSINELCKHYEALANNHVVKGPTGEISEVIQKLGALVRKKASQAPFARSKAH